MSVTTMNESMVAQGEAIKDLFHYAETSASEVVRLKDRLYDLRHVLSYQEGAQSNKDVPSSSRNSLIDTLKRTTFELQGIHNLVSELEEILGRPANE